MAKFVSVKDAYCLWHRFARVECALTAVVTGTVLLKLLWVTLPALAALGILDSSRRLYRDLFWAQALTLHSSKREGEPEIYAFMSRRHRSEHARRAMARFVTRNEDK